MKHASLPMGAVEIGTIAEAETDDEEDEEVIEGKKTKDTQTGWVHKGRKGPFNHFSFWFFMARIENWDIVR